TMNLHYYPETDSLYIELKNTPGAEAREIVAGLVVDFDANGNVVGLDIDHASRKLDLSKIETIALPPASAAEGTSAMLSDIAEERDAVADLCRRYDVRRLEVFGSAARGTHFDPKRSDFDFLVEFDPRSDLPPLKQFFGFAEALEQLLGRRVDLVERQ